jgi:RES domain-containing protein
MDPKEVLSGDGTQRYGGRFAAVGTRAVYFAESDAGASSEVLARKLRLGGQAQISLEKYPRLVFAVYRKTSKNLFSEAAQDRDLTPSGVCC